MGLVTAVKLNTTTAREMDADAAAATVSAHTAAVPAIWTMAQPKMLVVLSISEVVMASLMATSVTKEDDAGAATVHQQCKNDAPTVQHQSRENSS